MPEDQTSLERGYQEVIKRTADINHDISQNQKYDTDV